MGCGAGHRLANTLNPPLAKVLILHNASTLASLIASALASAGYDTRHECDGRSGLIAIRDFRPDLIFCAWRLKGYDGLDILTRVRGHRAMAGTQFIFLSESLDNALFRKGMDAGADDWLVMPVDLPGLLSCARGRLKRRAQVLGLPTEEFEMPLRATDHNVFLSYSRADRTLMKHVRDFLTNHGLSVWTDEQLEVGTPEWQTAVQKGIQRADCLVVLLSPEAKASKWVIRELMYASACNVRIFPLLASGDLDTAVPLLLMDAQFIDIRSGSPALLALARAIKRHVGYLADEG